MIAATRALPWVDPCYLSENAAHKTLCGIRWLRRDGAPVHPTCDRAVVYAYRCRPVFKFNAWHRQFSAASRTLLAYRKLLFRTRLMAFKLLVNAAKGLSSLQLSRNLGLHAKTASIFLRKLQSAST